jgi:hypothetical protein
MIGGAALEPPRLSQPSLQANTTIPVYQADRSITHITDNGYETGSNTGETAVQRL